MMRSKLTGAVFAAMAMLAGVPNTVVAATPQEARQDGAERARIEQARNDIESRTAEQEKACYQKFAVSDCQADLRARHRVALESLRKREVALNDAERRRNAAQQRQRTQEKAEEQAARTAQAQAQVPRAPREATPPPKAAPTSTVVRRPAATAAAPSASAIAENQRRFEQKQAEAQDHKAQVLKRLAEKPASTRAKPLPDAQ